MFICKRKDDRIDPASDYDILPAALKGEMAHDDRTTLVEDREELLDLSGEFLCDCFNVPRDRDMVTKENCPSLPMVLSMLRRSAVAGLPIGNWEGDRLIKAKRAIEYAVFAVIEAALRRIPWDHRFHHKLLNPLYACTALYSLYHRTTHSLFFCGSRYKPTLEIIT